MNEANNYDALIIVNGQESNIAVHFKGPDSYLSLFTSLSSEKKTAD